MGRNFRITQGLPVLLVLTCACGMAQAPASTPKSPLTISDAIREAVSNSLALMAEKHNISIAEARIVQAGLRPNPVFSAGLDYQDLLGRGFTVENNAGPPEAALRTDFLIEGGHKRERRLEVAREARTVAQLQYANSVRQLAFDVESAFVDMLLAKESLTLARENLKSLQELVGINRERVRTGDLAGVELSRSQIAELQFRNAVQQAELKLRAASNRLQLLIGRKEIDAAFDITGPLRHDVFPGDAAAVRQTALSIRPDLEALRRDQARSAAEIRLQIAQGKIDYTVSALYHHQYAYSNGRAFGFFVQFPLPVFNRNQGEIERARQEREQTDKRVRALEAAIGSEAENAFQQYSTARSLLQNLEASMLEQARKVRDTTEYSYRRGEASLIEFLDAQRAFNDTMQTYNEARVEYARSLYLLDSVSGKVDLP